MQTILSSKPPVVLEDDFNVATNEDWVREWQLKNDDEIVPLDTSWKLYSQLQRQNTGDIAVMLSTDNGRLVVTDRQAGKFGLRLKQADANQCPPGTYLYDIVLVAGDGIYRLVTGTIIVQQGITNVPGQETWKHVPLILRP
ncbi:hypothetical protein FXV83_16540 [Bradyrhizobium hipponense]|uniref:Uncharacterized protein n=1 Tax=Bradyrhizobium hipponense TaxID=2605638 RepID=A0A5S4YWW9_9BRAD|nr:hypothetical protein [Bradyrhizobium hipponense]TYO65539.1 hypothetical protein FXV83_16540 [Bradyrhizobium hipponense]